jgi:NhaP-type Na+/H+ or K+/H+ antiporter
VRTIDADYGRQWSISLEDAPSSFSCVMTLLAASLVFVLLGAQVFSRKEFRVKTPEGG